MDETGLLEDRLVLEAIQDLLHRKNVQHVLDPFVDHTTKPASRLPSLGWSCTMSTCGTKENTGHDGECPLLTVTDDYIDPKHDATTA